jgi:hypothetical protein
MMMKAATRSEMIKSRSHTETKGTARERASAGTTATGTAPGWARSAETGISIQFYMMCSGEY